MTDAATRSSAGLPSGKAIYCIVPDDGTDKRLLLELRETFGVVSAGTSTWRGIGALGDVKVKRGKLPEAVAVRVLHVVCRDDQADDVFNHMFWSGHFDKPGRGMVWQEAVTAVTPFELPTDIADEGRPKITDSSP